MADRAGRQMTSAKAVASAIAGHFTILALWAITQVPGWESMPDEPRLALQGLVVSLINGGLVYFAPANAIRKPIRKDEKDASHFGV